MRTHAFVLIFLLLFYQSRSQLNLTIFHNSDMYSRFEEMLDYKTEKMIGGFARLAQVLESARNKAYPKSSNHILYLNAGNTFTGTYLYHIHRWRIVSSLMNILKPDAITLGSEEFVDGLQGLEPFLDEIKFSVVAANIRAENGTFFSRKVHPSIVLNMTNIPVGIIGYTGRDTQKKYPVGNLQFTDELTAVQNECKRLSDSGVKIVIALGNADFGTDLNIAKNADCLDVVVGGDSELFLWNDDPNKLLEDNPSSTYPMLIPNIRGKTVPLLEGYSKTRYVGKIDLAFDPEGNLINYKGNPVLLDEEVSKSDRVGPLLATFTSPSPHLKNADSGDTVVGRTKVFLSAEKCREEECNFGNMIVDAFVEFKAAKYKGKYWTDTPLAFMNAGALRRSINTTKHGFNITTKDLELAIPFRQPLITVVLQGIDLKHTLEVGARYNGETRRGEFLVLSGFRVVYDFKRPPFHRVASVLVRCGKCKTPSYFPLNYNDYYRVMTTVYLANGGDGHTAIRRSSLSFALEGLTEFAATTNYLQTYKEVRPECDDRIVHMRLLGSSQKSVLYNQDESGLVFIVIIAADLFYIFLSVNYLFA